MKYLKLFEDIKSFKEISIGEYSLSSTEYKLSDFTGPEITNIRSILNINVTMIYHSIRNREYKSIIEIKYQNKLKYTISKFEDDWFFVYNHLSNTRYKCDQLDGLIDYLNNDIS